jgi:hypothetical protein
LCLEFPRKEYGIFLEFDMKDFAGSFWVDIYPEFVDLDYDSIVRLMG